MDGCERWHIDLLDHGFIALVDTMPRLVPQGQTADAAIVQAARVSYGHGTKRIHEDRGLVRYLMRHRHTTPFEMVEFKFHVAMPVFVARQWIRHRTASVNEYSGRYSIIPDTFYRPAIDQVRKQSASNRQGGDERFVVFAESGGGDPAAASGDARTAEDFLAYLDEAHASYAKYATLTQRGVSRELARIGLPISVYTQWYWKCDLHNILRFLALRLDAHAQHEIRVYAEAMAALIEPIVPITFEAFRDYELGAIRLTRLEVDAMRAGFQGRPADVATENKREREEWATKRRTLGMPES